MQLGDGRFEILRTLGEGGSGVVYEALDTRRGAKVALKTLAQANAASVSHLKREFRSLADLVHPNLVSLYELFALDGEVFFTMELVDGVTFSKFARRQDGPVSLPVEQETTRSHHETDVTELRLDRLTPAELLEASPSVAPLEASTVRIDEILLRPLLRQLAEGVAAIHKGGFLHRDLKPSNVLVSHHGRLVILDFGLVSAVEEENRATEDRPLEGTVAFMSPEQAARAPLGPASDWYSVGAMLYHALTGRPPFHGRDREVLMAKVQFDPPPPLVLAPGTPPDLSALCMRLLSREAAARPSGDELLGVLASGSRSKVITLGSVTTSGEPLVGRKEPLRALAAGLDATRAGAGVLALVRGLSGMGKSRVVRAFLEQAQTQGAVVLQGRCYERESMPFKALDSLVEALARHLLALPQAQVAPWVPAGCAAMVRLFPVLRQVEAFAQATGAAPPAAQELRTQAFGALRQLVGWVAQAQPLVLAIDDVQWGDSDSARLLGALMRAPDSPWVMVVLSHRTEGAGESEFLKELATQTTGGVDVRQVEIGPLSHLDAQRLAMTHLGGTPVSPALLQRMLFESGGIPYFVEELARAVKEDNATAPMGIQDLLAARLARLPPLALQLLTTIAVAGRPLPQELAKRAAGVEDPAMLQVLKAAGCVRGRTQGGWQVLECYHDRVREAAVAALPAAGLREHHSKLALAYGAAPTPDLEALAQHHAGAGNSTRAAEFAVLAARKADQTLAFERAAQFYRMALDLDPAQPRTLFVALADAYANAGRTQDSAQAYLAALPGSPAAQALDLRRRAASQLLFGGHLDAGLELLVQVLAQTGMSLAPTPGAALWSLLWRRAALSMRGLGYVERSEVDLPASQLLKVDVAHQVGAALSMADPIRSADFHARHLRLALKAGEPHRAAQALAAEAGFVSLAGVSTLKKCYAIMDRALALANRLGEPATQGIVLGTLGMVHFHFGQWQACLDAFEQAQTLFRLKCVGHQWELATCQIYHLLAHVTLGNLQHVARQLPGILMEANARGDLYSATTLQTALGAYLPIMRNEPMQAYRVVDDALEQWSAQGFHLQHANALNSKLSLDLYQGDTGAAVERWDTQWPALQKSMLLRVQVMRVLLMAVHARVLIAHAAASGDHAGLAKAAQVARTMRKEGALHAQAQGLGLDACIALVRGQKALSVQLFESAHHAVEDAGLHLMGACFGWVRGQVLGGERGAALVAQGETFMRHAGLPNPAAVANIFAPGLPS